ncbi:hypothetical protein JCGZ_09679 [Jatropha curcas]|uniref:Uncharacterized protein n=1 Tax=Jatropha curcas TaxID=180498 RepID=A0A067LL24_JATCU|nr:hypothetical protein JCGZ_09679 [Jatropha curcas]
MAGIDTQKQLLTLIRDCVSEKSQGERRVVGLKKRIEELRSEFEAVHAELEGAKRLKETTEQELKGYEFELAMNVTSIQILEGRISQIQDEISSIGSEVEGLKVNEERAARDEFISQMFELNARIRKFQERGTSNFQKEDNSGTAAGEGLKADRKVVMEVVVEPDLRTLDNMLAHVVSQTTKEEQEYIAEQNIQKQIQQEYVDLQRKISLMEVIMKETKALQDLTRYP